MRVPLLCLVLLSAAWFGWIVAVASPDEEFGCFAWLYLVAALIGWLYCAALWKAFGTAMVAGFAGTHAALLGWGGLFALDRFGDTVLESEQSAAMFALIVMPAIVIAVVAALVTGGLISKREN